MARTIYPVTTQIKDAWTPPAKVQDMKFYSEYADPNEDLYWNPEKVLFSFTFYEDEKEARSDPELFLIQSENLDTGEIQNFTQLYDKPYYRYWQRQDEDGADVDTSEYIINARVTITPVNDFGEGETSSFILPFKDLVWTRSKDNQAQETFSVLNRDWSLFSEDPTQRKSRPKLMYIYLDVDESIIEQDRIRLGTPQWEFDSIANNSDEINQNTYRWSVSDQGYRKLDRDGWDNMIQEEQTFITDLIQTMLPAYRDYLNIYGITQDKPHVFKMAIENPEDTRDTIIIYMMKGSQWEV